MNDPWFTLLRWLILAGLAVGLVAVPTIYVNHRIDAAHEQGVVDGRSACVADYAAKVVEQAKKDQATIKAEADRANKAEDVAQKLAANAAKTEKKLNEALAENKNLISPTCNLPKSAVDILRDASNGTFPASNGEAFPSPFTSGVRNRS